jgi:MFS family permease
MKSLAVVFGLAGGVTASFAARVPAVQDRLGLAPGRLGLAFLALEAGAVAGLPAAGALAARFGSRRSLRAALALLPGALVAVGLAPSFGGLALSLAALAAATSVVDVAMNAQAVELERRAGRPRLSRLHGIHSAGVLCGGLGGAAAAAVGVAPAAQFAAVAAVALAAGQAATRALPEPTRKPSPPTPLIARPSRPLLVLGALAFCTFLADGAASNWSAAETRAKGASPAVAAAAFTAFALSMTAVRLAGARGRRRAGLLIAAGAALAALAPPPLTLAGWALAGAGVAPIAPAVMRAAGKDGPVAIAGVTTVGYLGSFTGPPVIGALAGAASLPAALAVIAAAGLVAAALRPPR